MSTQQTNVQKPITTEKDVAAYLRAHPEFFDTHTDVLAELRLQHPALGAVSLIERQVSALREQKRALEKRLSNLIQVAHENEKLNQRMQKFTLALMEQTNAAEVLCEARRRLLEDFEADSVVVRLLQHGDAAIDVEKIAVLHHEEDAYAAFRQFFDSRKPVCGRLNTTQSQYLFADDSEAIASAALVPICDFQCFGMLAIGSKDPKRFHPTMGTVFLTYMGEVMGRALRPYLAGLMR